MWGEPEVVLVEMVKADGLTFLDTNRNPFHHLFDRILIETDSPYLAPVPFRGQPCGPAMVVHTARRVAELRGESLEALADTTTANARR